ncbi:MAG: radical SAM protein [Lachnospiraceae bacterium]|nr:radical SAM protein [Lachnospiraceae bacterium]
MQFKITLLDECRLCPRECGVNRNKGETGYCRSDSRLIVSRAALHYWEEPCISSDKGSGAVFFSGCSLGCVYCQNRQISKGNAGKEISIDRLVEIFFELKDEGANNINLVTPTHYICHIREALLKARKEGLDLPVVYNSGGYEKTESLKLLDGLIDIYLPDMKYIDSGLSKKYSFSEDYFEAANKAIREMVRQVGEPRFNENGIMTRGVIVRHLVLPNNTGNSKNVIKHLYENYGDKIYISIMNQYTPMNNIDKERYSELTRKITKREYGKVVDYAIELGVVNGFVQEGDTAKESYIPDFGSSV